MVARRLSRRFDFASIVPTAVIVTVKNWTAYGAVLVGVLMQRQTAVTAYFSSKRLLLFAFAGGGTRARIPLVYLAQVTDGRDTYHP